MLVGGRVGVDIPLCEGEGVRVTIGRPWGDKMPEGVTGNTGGVHSSLTTWMVRSFSWLASRDVS